MKKTLVIITARAGSKGILNKNLIKINGKPLIHFTLEVASTLVSEGSVDDVVFTTDSEEMINFAKNYPFITSVRRPDHLAMDDTKSIDVVYDLILEFNGKGDFWESIVLLQPTSPLRKVAHVREALELFMSNNSESLISGYINNDGILNKLYYLDGNFGKPISKEHNEGKPRNLLKSFFVRNASIYITKVSYLIEKKSIISERPLLYTMSKNSSLDLNDYDDLELIKCLISK
jgi:CMP-N,N'-diacetyllegionaminic acid synthase